jgi:hypothetical protein
VRFVGAFDLVARMGKFCGKLAIIGEEDQPLRVVVQTSDGVYVLTDINQQINDGWTALRVRPGRHISFGLVEQDVTVAFRRPYSPPIDADVVSGGVRFGSHFTNRPAVD